MGANSKTRNLEFGRSFLKSIIREVYQRMKDMLRYIQIVLKDNLEMYQFIHNLVTGQWEKMNQLLHALDICVYSILLFIVLVNKFFTNQREKEEASC